MEQEKKTLGEPLQKQNIEQLLAAGTPVQFAPTGFSMYPLFDPGKGDQAVVAPLGDTTLKRGMVALYRRDGDPSELDEQGQSCGILVLHRIVKIDENSVYFIGDNQDRVEGPLRIDQIRGVLTARVRKGKELSVDNPLYKLSTGLWLALLPCRTPIRKILAGIKKGIVCIFPKQHR